MGRGAIKAAGNGTAANLGFEAKLGFVADGALGNDIDPAEFKNFVVGVISPIETEELAGDRAASTSLVLPCC